MNLTNKHIVLGVTGGIAAYKSAELVRQLKEQGAEVRVVLTAAAQAFVTALTFQALSGNPVHDSLFDPQAEAGMGHIQLARWADLILIAPASADFIAKLTAGLCDDLLSTVCLASAAPIMLAPAMNQQMWHASATQENISKLIQRGLRIEGPAEGLQACGDMGVGRMLEPEQIIACAAKLVHPPHPERLGNGDSVARMEIFSRRALFSGLHVLLTAGPTQEDIDPIRYISNRSSGKMGYALADAAAEAGAKVTLVSGPVASSVIDLLHNPVFCPVGEAAPSTAAQHIETYVSSGTQAQQSLTAKDAGYARGLMSSLAAVIKLIKVKTALEMYKAVMLDAADCDIFIAVAAVADYRCKVAASHKIAKKEQTLHLELIKNPDIAASVAGLAAKPFVLGFAAETEDILHKAQAKLVNKKLDMIAVNQVGASSHGFDSDFNALTILWDGGQQELALARKSQLARNLIQIIKERYDVYESRTKDST